MPSTRYHLLKPEAKLEIIAFLCELAMQTKVARDAMEESTSQLTEVRKEMQDVKRDRRKVYVARCRSPRSTSPR
jgi:bromodomain adjacent to zinc finger domain protein 1A